MRLKPRAWYCISLLLFIASICMWRYADKYGASHGRGTNHAGATNGLSHPPLINAVATNAVAKRTTYRISNTDQKIAQLLHNSHAIILRNALIDTERPVGLKIPDHLRAKGAPGSYLVQADRPLDNAFYAELSKAGAAYISYVPNNTALVAATPTVATNLAANPDVVAVLPYEPYYKLDSTLLPSAVEQEPQTNALSVTTFPGQRDAAMAALTQLGATLIGEDRSPFGPTLVVQVPPTSLVAVAQMPLAQEIEVYTPRRIMNDLTRYLMGESTNTSIGTPTYLNLSGKQVTVNLNDTGVDATHPDLTGRMIGDFPSSLTDGDGHGTHVAGIIAGSGSKSTTVLPPIPGSITNADFRGKATNATLFVQALDLTYGPFISDAFLQENASTNLGPTNLISNNSWGYGSTVYDTHAASFDAATRDSQPNVDGEQPLLFVFAAGNNGNSPGSITSPGTAKNVITVAASQSPRFITNEVYEDTDTNDIGEIFYYDTSNTNVVASFSSGGNVDPGVEGTYGRFKPDVVAPGVFTVSCRSSEYQDPTVSVIVNDGQYLGQTVAVHNTNYYGMHLQLDPNGYTASALTVVVSSNAASPIPFPTNMMLLADPFDPPTDILATNFRPGVAYSVSNFVPGDTWYFGVSPPTNQPGPVSYDLNIYQFETNYLGDYFQVLSNLNYPLKPYYLYQSGTSMAAGAVSGTLALMQEFLQSRMSITNPSPALMKAMLINGSRTMALQYDFDVNTSGVNQQGWGMPNLPSILPPSLTNSNPSMVLFDQATNRALATGQYQTYTIACSDPNASTAYPLRISLVWTDPPGNPAAGVALVNNLQLTVADDSGTNIYIGNDFLSGDIFTEISSPTNLPGGESDNEAQNVFVNQGTPVVTSAGDSINNVQNVYITPAYGPIQFPLTVTISGTRVNVNAVTTQTNNILQDYALVISSDDPKLTSPLTATPNSIATNTVPLITVASNGIPLLHQRVGANEPNLYNFTLGDTNGGLSQWHFFIFTNSGVIVSNTTNVAFATFLPPNLSIPRASGSADIDLYVLAPANAFTTPDFATFLSGPGGLDAFASQAVKSVGRTGTESVIFTNSTVPVYYVGVKSEDQQASDFGFYAIAQSNSFSATGNNGNTITTGPIPTLPVGIPTSLSPVPALVFAFMENPSGKQIRRVTVNDGVAFGTPGSLYGTLQHDGISTVLNNFSAPSLDPGFTNTYDDLQENPNSGDISSDGPGHLTQYVNQEPDGLWLLAQANDDQSESGFVTTYSVSVDLHQPPSGFFVTIPPNSWFDDYVDVPNDATNMIIYTLYESEGTNAAGNGPVGIYLTNAIGVITTSDYGSNGIVPPGGSLSLNTNNPVVGWPGAPPLAGGYWYYGIYNYNTTQPVTLYVQIQFQQSLTPNLVQTYTNNSFIPLTTDGHTQSQICVSNGQQIVSLQVGLLINDPDLDDLSIHLTSPEGTSVLLFENRGGSNATGLGQVIISSNVTATATNYSTNFVYTVFTENTNLATTPIKFAPPPYSTNDIVSNLSLITNSFEGLAAGIYTNNNTNVVILDGWLVTNNIVTMLTTNGNLGYYTNNTVGIVTDPAGDQVGSTNLGTNYLALTSGRIIQTFGVTNGFTVTNGMPYELVFYAKPMGVVDWWPANGDAHDVIGTNNGCISVITNLTTNGTVVTTNFVPLVTYDTGEVGRAFAFSATNGTVSFGTNTGNFGTNDFSIDFWIQSTNFNPGVVPILQKGTYCTNYANYFGVLLSNGSICYEQSYNADTPPPFSVSSTTNIGTNLLNICDGLYHHVAFTREGTTNSIYIDGVLNTNAINPEISMITNTNMLFAGGSNCDAAAFVGNLDELDLVSRALSPAEVYAIYHAGSLGKNNTNSILPNFQLTIDDISTNNIAFTNASGGWELFTNTFYATNGMVTVEFAGNPMGVLLDDIQLVQLASTNYENYYLPEEPLTPFVGENPIGCWTLDVWDTRQDSPLPTNGELLGWNMQVTTSSTNAVLYVLTNEEPFTISNLAGSITYFAVDVPSYATFATNFLTVLSGSPLTLLFNQNALPTGGLPGDMTLLAGVAAGPTASNTLATLGAPPPLLPGQRYFLGVLNNGPGASTFKIEVDFNGMTNKIIPLTNSVPYTNTVGTNSSGTNGPQYYSFLVPTNAVMVTFQIIGASNGEVDLYANDGLPLPGPLMFDYNSCNAGTNDQFIVVTTNSVPVSLPGPSTNLLDEPKPSTWYLAAYNFAQKSNITYTIIATVVTNDLQIIPLTNSTPYYNTNSPGYPSNLLYSFTITNNVGGVTFTVTNLSLMGNVQLLANLDGFPTPQQTLAGSYNLGTNNQIIQILPTAAIPSLIGTWYLAVPNTSDTNVSYSITATTNVLLPLTWRGTFGSDWDLVTSNWVITADPATNAAYQNGEAVTFDDSALTATNVNLMQALYPASITVSNTVYDFLFTGNGSVNETPLTLNGTLSTIWDNTNGNSFSSVVINKGGNLVMENTGADSFTSVVINNGTLLLDNPGGDNFTSVLINNGTLQVGNGDANGSLGGVSVDTGPGSGTNIGRLVFDRTNDIFVPNIITDTGILVQAGTGTNYLFGVNTYSGGTTISAGTLMPENTNALGVGGGRGSPNLIDGGTLDLSALPAAYPPGSPLFAGQIFKIAGAGATGIGAIVNNGVNEQLGGLGAVRLTGDASIGGNTRWDIRYDGINSNFDIAPFTLTKTGTNQISLVSILTDGGSIVIDQGILSFEITPDFSSSTNAITVNSNGLVGQNLDTLGSFTQTIILNGGGTTNLSGSNITYLDAPITLTNNSSLGNGGGIEIFNGIISGPCGFTNLGIGSNLLSATNTYTGSTIIAQGTLALTNTGSITNSTNITVNPGATLDASQRTNQTLILYSNQTLIDNGTILGTNLIATNGSTVSGGGLVASNLFILANATLAPGTTGTMGTLTAGGMAVLRGTNYMKLNKSLAPGQSNDVLTATTIDFGGTLIVTNVSGTNAFAEGDSFTLFVATNSFDSFTSITLPPLPAGLAWANNFGINGGTITVVANTPAVFSSISFSLQAGGSNLIFRGSNGVPGGEYLLLTTTNLTVPLSNWATIFTSNYDDSGNFLLTNPIGTNAQQFYLLESP